MFGPPVSPFDPQLHRFNFEGLHRELLPLFRRRCFEDVGGYIANPGGGVDWIAVTTARMKGWKPRSFPEKRFHHYRALGTAGRSGLAAIFSYGEKDYYLGGSPVWQFFRVTYRMTKRPVLLTVFTVTAVLAVAVAISAQAADPWFETWKADPAKSKSVLDSLEEEMASLLGRPAEKSEKQ